MKRWIWTLTLVFALLLPTSALAEQALSAQVNERGVQVTWNTEEASGNATLTLYRNGWPIMVSCVDYEAGECTLPAWYVQRAGSYTVRLKTDMGCEQTEVIRKENQSAEKPDAQPTAEPTVTPTAQPTIQPTAAPTAAPTAEPTVIPTEKPTQAPTAAPTTAPTQAPSGSDSSDLASQVVAQVNAERAAAGLNSLTVDADLTAAACVRAREIVELFSHTRPDGSSWSTVSSKVNGENIAMGYRTADAVMAGWMNSVGHRENILRSSFGSIGVIAVPEMERCYRYALIEKQFPHHAAVAFEHLGGLLFDIFKLLGVTDISYNRPRNIPYPNENPYVW